MNIVKFKTLGYNSKVSASFTDYYLYTDLETLIQNFNSIKTVSSLNNGDLVFIPSWVDFPRYKLREYGVLHNINITRDPAKADSIVIDKQLGIIDKLCYNNRWSRFNTKVLNGETYIDYGYKNDGIYFITSNVNNTLLTGLEQILNYPNKKFIDIGDLAKLTNTQGLILTEKHYDNLSRMLTSASQEDVELAMEQLANCNFAESLVKIWTLYSRNKTICDRSKFSKGVNFTNLINYFKSVGLNPGNHYSNTSFSDIIASLYVAQIEISIEDLDILREGLKVEIEESISGFSDSEHGFKIHNFDVEFLLKRKEPVIEKVKTGLELV